MMDRREKEKKGKKEQEQGWEGEGEKAVIKGNSAPNGRTVFG